MLNLKQFKVLFIDGISFSFAVGKTYIIQHSGQNIGTVDLHGCLYLIGNNNHKISIPLTGLPWYSNTWIELFIGDALSNRVIKYLKRYLRDNPHALSSSWPFLSKEIQECL